MAEPAEPKPATDPDETVDADAPVDLERPEEPGDADAQPV